MSIILSCASQFPFLYLHRSTHPEQRVVGFSAFRVEYDDGVAERSWIWMRGEAAPCEGIIVIW